MRPAAEVSLRDRDDQAQVGLHHLLLGVHVAALDPLRERHLLLGGEQLDLADRAQVQPQRVEARLDRQVELRSPRLARARPPGAATLPSAAGSTHQLGRDQLDSLIDQMRVELAQLLVGELELLEARGELFLRQEAPLLALRKKLPQLLELLGSATSARSTSSRDATSPTVDLPIADIRPLACPSMGTHHTNCLVFRSRHPPRGAGPPCCHDTRTARPPQPGRIIDPTR